MAPVQVRCWGKFSHVEGSRDSQVQTLPMFQKEGGNPRLLWLQMAMQGFSAGNAEKYYWVKKVNASCWEVQDPLNIRCGSLFESICHVVGTWKFKENQGKSDLRLLLRAIRSVVLTNYDSCLWLSTYCVAIRGRNFNAHPYRVFAFLPGHRGPCISSPLVVRKGHVMTLCHGDVSRSIVRHIQASQSQYVGMSAPCCLPWFTMATPCWDRGATRWKQPVSPGSRKSGGPLPNCIRIYVHQHALLLC